MSQNIESEWKLRKFRKEHIQYKVVKPIASSSFGDVFQIKNKGNQCCQNFKGNIINNREIMILANFQQLLNSKDFHYMIFTAIKMSGFSLNITVKALLKWKVNNLLQNSEVKHNFFDWFIWNFRTI